MILILYWRECWLFNEINRIKASWAISKHEKALGWNTEGKAAKLLMVTFASFSIIYFKAESFCFRDVGPKMLEFFEKYFKVFGVLQFPWFSVKKLINDFFSCTAHVISKIILKIPSPSRYPLLCTVPGLGFVKLL